MEALKIIWSLQAKNAVKDIFGFHKIRNIQFAKRIKSEIIASKKKTVFSKQYQLDDINPKYRRIVVGDYKIIYKEDGLKILVLDVISTKQTPEILRNK